jgi:uncharacterized membrane protein YczE
VTVERLVRCVVGLAVFGLGIRMVIAGDLGLAPWDVFHQGLSRHTGIGIGTCIILVGLVLIAVNWGVLSVRPGIGTILNAVEIGLVVNLIGDHLPHSERIVARLAYVVGGVLVVALGSGLYLGADIGAGPRDGLMLGLGERGLSIRVARTMIEATVLVAGIALGGSAGIGTLIFAVGIGPVVHATLPRFALAPRSTPTAVTPAEV